MASQTSSLTSRLRQKANARTLGRAGWAIFRLVIIAGLCFQILYPFIIKILKAFMSTGDLTDPTVKIYPRHFSTYFWQTAFDNMDYISNFFNSLVMALSVALIQILICSMVGYGLAKFRFKARGYVFVLVIATLLVPPQVYSSPMFLLFKTLGLTDTPFPNILLSLLGIGFRNGLYIFIMRQFFIGMPKELEEAAYIDGYGPYATFFRIMLPNALNMIIVVFMLSFAWQWTDVFYSHLLNIKNSNLAVAILNITQVMATGEKMDQAVFFVIRNTATLLLVAPLLVLFGFAQKRLIEGVERSGIVG